MSAKKKKKDCGIANNAPLKKIYIVKLESISPEGFMNTASALIRTKL